MKKVLVWTEQHGVGGNDRFLVDLLRGLEGRPWEVRVAGVPNADWDEWLGERVPWAVPKVDVPVVTLTNSPLNRLRPAPDPGDEPASELSQGGGPAPLTAAVAAVRYRQWAWNRARLRRVLRGARPDVLFINNGGYPGAESCRVAALAAKDAGVPRVVHYVHNMPFPPHWPASLERTLDRQVDAAVDAWVTGAERSSQALASERGMTGVHTVHYGIPPFGTVAPAGDAGFAADAFNVAVVAAFEPRKGHAVLLEAARALGPSVRFALAGEGEALERTRRAAEGLDNVAFLGRRGDVPAILAAADALVLPSLSNECLPYAILEAMAAGLPCVGTDVAGIPEEIADGETGFVVPPGDADALTAAIRRLAGDRALAARMGEAGRARAESHFSIPRMVEEIEALWAASG